MSDILALISNIGIAQIIGTAIVFFLIIAAFKGSGGGDKGDKNGKSSGSGKEPPKTSGQ